MTIPVTLIQGGGTGFDQAKAVRRVFEAAGADIEWSEHFAGRLALEQGQDSLSESMLESVRQTGRALKTRLFTPRKLTRNEEVGPNYNLRFREEMEVFASVRPVKNVAGLRSRFQDVDILVIRELTEDLYTAIEHEIISGVVQSLKIVTEKASRRFFRFAFQWAREHGRKKAHCVHKANILKLADGLFLKAFREVAQEYPDIEAHEIIVDNCCMQMVSRPHQFDVMMMGNLYGDLVSDLGAGLVGGVSVTAGVNVGEQVSVYESFHGATHREIGEDQVNPLPLLFPALDMLRHAGEQETAQRIHTAIESVLTQPENLTFDLNGKATTSRMTYAIIAELPQ